MKIAILGNGAIGAMTALKLSNSGNAITIFGDKRRQGSASLAAGAMINVMAEIEEDQLDFEPLKLKFELAYSSQRKWDEFVSKNFTPSQNREFKKRFTTILANNKTTPFEKKQFDYLKNIRKKFSEDIKFDKFSKKREIILPRERFIDSKILLKNLDDLLLKNNVEIIYDVKSYELKKSNRKIQINYNKKKETFDFIIVALGSFAEEFNNLNRKLVGKIPMIYNGVGTAFSIIKKPYTKKFKEINYVLRTMNRGTACGFHLIPLSKNELYFGASNSVSQIREKYPRIGSLAVLTNGLINEFDKNLKDNNIQVRFGYRPISADTFPILGPLKNHPEIIYATGNKRDGLTCSIEISDLISKYVSGDKYAFEKYQIFNPNRKLISYYKKNIAITKAAETIVAGRLMHDDNLFQENWNKLVNKEIEHINKVYQKLNLKSFGIHPELINMYKHNRI